METIKKSVKLITPQDVKDFCFAASSLPRNTLVQAEHDGYKVDAKSILGMLSLNLSEIIDVTVIGEDIDESRVDELFAKWKVGT